MAFSLLRDYVVMRRRCERSESISQCPPCSSSSIRVCSSVFDSSRLSSSIGNCLRFPSEKKNNIEQCRFKTPVKSLADNFFTVTMMTTDPSFAKSADPQDPKNEPMNYIAEIRRMMYGFGDCPEPLVESAKIVEDVVHRQMRSLVYKACEVADRRNSKTVTEDDFIFLLRSNKMKLRRLLKYLEIKEFKASVHKILEAESFEDSLEDLTDNPLRKKRSYNKIVSLIDNTGELLENQSAIDHVKHNRKLRAEMMSRKIDEARYMDYSRARCISFANRNQHKFSVWIGCEGDMKVTKQGYVVLGYLAYETVAEIVDLSLLVRQDQNKIHGDSIDRLKLSYHNPYTYKPYQHSKGTVTKAITPAEINEALRRYWSPQLDITGPFHRWTMHRPHLKLLSC